jgi:hypothetical protein
MRNCLVFNSELDSLAVESKISQNMGLPCPSGTLRWAVPKQRVTDNKWYIEKPDEQFLNGTDSVVYITEEFSVSWVGE